MKVRKLRNLVGPQVRRIRWQKKWSQEQLTNKLQDLGWNICRQRLARIESCEAWVSDFEMLLIATSLEIKVLDLFPKIPITKPLYEVLSDMMAGQVKSLVAPEKILYDRSVSLCSVLRDHD
ncbi:MAG: hypothetical protein M3Y82_10105 [Verrucomicrobiota bacterium]|nr:hypothetical protein [Verrucomicrobiota bacterium]